MPTFEFTSPEGVKYSVEGPEGATQEQAFAILQQQLGAGVPNKEIDPSIPRVDVTGHYIRDEKPADIGPKRSLIEDLGRQVGLTARYGIEGVANGAGMLTDPFVNAIGGAVRAVTGKEYDPATLSKIGQHVADALGLPQPETPMERVVGAVARGMAGAGAGAAAAGGIAGATTGTTQAVAQQLAAQPGAQIAAGAAAGGAGQTTAEAGGGPGAQLAASLAAGVAVPAAIAGATRVAAMRNAGISPEQQAILDAGKAADVPVLTSDVLPPKTFMGKQAQAVGERIPVAGTAGVREAQQEARQAAVAKVAEKYGAPSYEAIVSSIKGKVGAIKRAAGNVIDKTGKELDAAGAVVPVKSVQSIDDAIAELSKPNVYNRGTAGHIQELVDLKDALQSGQQSFSTLRQSRTAVRELLDSVDATGRSQLPSNAKRLVTQVYNAMKSDMDDFASVNLSPEKFGKLQRANQVYGDQSQLLKASRLKNVLDKGDITPENVRNLIYSNKPSENQILYDSLGTAGRAQVRSALINDAATKALRDGVVNPNAFGAELAKHGKKLDIFFHGPERDSIQGLIKLLRVTRRAQDAAVAPTTTGATLTPYALGASALADLGKTVTAAVTAGGLARMYESAPVRNLLLKLSAVRPNTPQEAKYARAIAAALQERTERQPVTQQPTQMPAPVLADAQDTQN